MAQLESFSNLTKQSDDILKKNFAFGQTLALSVYSKYDSLSLKANLKQASSNLSSLAYFQYKGDNILFKQELSSISQSKLAQPGRLRSSFEYTWESRPFIKTKVEFDSASDYQQNTYSVEVSKDAYRYKLSLVDKPLFKLSGVWGKKDFGAGLDLTYDLGPLRFTNYNAAAWLSNDRWRSVLKHESNNDRAYTLGNLVASVYFRDFHSWAVGVNGKFNPAEKTKELCLASQNQLDKDNLIKGRINLDGRLALALRSRLNSSVQVVTAIEFNPLDKHSEVKYGLRVKLNQ